MVGMISFQGYLIKPLVCAHRIMSSEDSAAMTPWPKRSIVAGSGTGASPVEIEKFSES